MPEQNAIHFELAGRRGDFQLDIKAILPESGVTVIFGRSGCGKTTLLRGLAGLENLSGVIRVGDTTWLDSRAKLMLRPEQRRVGYVFQEAALLPHLSVQGNLDFASKRAPEPHRISIQRAVEWLSLEPLLRRQPAVLSGGERQRVAIARALVSNPRLLLMDEPLASLDAGARDTILRHLEGLTDALAVPMLYVTHSIDEAVRLGDRVLWLDAGRVQALGSPLEVFSRLDLGGLLGEEAGGVVSAAIASHDGQYDLTVLDTVWGPDVYVEPRTVDVHIGRLRKALNQRNASEVIRTVRGAGYSLDKDF